MAAIMPSYLHHVMIHAHEVAHVSGGTVDALTELDRADADISCRG
jgi:hypothetical protein